MCVSKCAILKEENRAQCLKGEMRSAYGRAALYGEKLLNEMLTETSMIDLHRGKGSAYAADIEPPVALRL